MNKECRIVLKALNLLNPTDIIIISANKQSMDQEWSGFVQTVKSFIKQESKSMKEELNDNFETLEETLND